MTPKEMQEEIEKRVAEEVKQELTPLDVESLYDEMLDECYSFKSMGGPFRYMRPSKVLEECDPVAYRCGLLDYFDSLSKERDFEEIDEKLYDADEVEKIRDRVTSEVEENKKSEEEDD